MNIWNSVNPDEELKRRVMFRVKLIFYFRRFSTPLAIEGLLFVAFTVLTLLSVSIRNIIHNISELEYVSDGFGYMYRATLHTTITVQISMFVTLVLAAVLAKNFYRNMRTAV
ncbi:MAG: hypothetical protein WCV79_03035 [Candidatus Paceibacterota bacterium]